MLKTKSELLSLNSHKTLGDYIIVVAAEIVEPGITSRVSQFEDRPEIGLVVGVGESVTTIAEGDVVFFGKYSSIQVTHDEITYLIMRHEDVYCVT